MTSLSTLDKDKVALLLDLLYASELSFILANEAFAGLGGEAYAIDTGFFLLDEKPLLQQGAFHFELYLMDKDLSRQSKAANYVALSRKKLLIQARYEENGWLIDHFEVQKLPKSEKRVFKTVEPLIETVEWQTAQKNLIKEASHTQLIRDRQPDPRIVTVGDISFFTLKKHPGRNIGQFLKNPKYRSMFRIENLVDWSIAICEDLLTQFHRKGLLHRDIKPGNIILNPHNTHEAQLVDLEVVIDESSPSQSLEGTDGYIAPELYKTLAQIQISGSREVLCLPYSKKTDILALAYTLSELFGNTAIHDLYQAYGKDKAALLTNIIAMQYQTTADKKFRNLFVIQKEDIFRDYPNPKSADKIKEDLIYIFMKMSQIKASKRPSVEKVIAALGQIKVRMNRDFAKATKTALKEEPEPGTSGPAI